MGCIESNVIVDHGLRQRRDLLPNGFAGGDASAKPTAKGQDHPCALLSAGQKGTCSRVTSALDGVLVAAL